MKILFLDTESTGLPLWREPSSHPGQPHIVDLSCELRDDETMELIGSMDCIINPGVPIPPEVAAIHGITDEIARGGREPKAALTDFFALVDQADKIVGHNIGFDTRLIRIQAARIWSKDWVAPVPTFCTMKALTNVCRIPSPNGRSGFKWPKLTEAIKHLFGEDMPDAHRAKPDMLACQRIYFHLHPPIAAKQTSKVGLEEGDPCNRINEEGFACDGEMFLPEVKGCSCHISPPCGAYVLRPLSPHAANDCG